MSLPAPPPGAYERFASQSDPSEIAIPARGFAIERLLRAPASSSFAKYRMLTSTQTTEVLNNWYINASRYLQGGLEIDRDKHHFVGALHLGVVALELLNDGISFEDLHKGLSAQTLGHHAVWETERRLSIPSGHDTDNDLQATFKREDIEDMSFQNLALGYKYCLNDALYATINGPQPY